MKKIFIIIALLFTQLFYAQVSNTKTVRINDATTAFSKNLSIGTQVYNVATGELFIANAAVLNTATLTTASGSFDLVGSDNLVTHTTGLSINVKAFVMHINGADVTIPTATITLAASNTFYIGADLVDYTMHYLRRDYQDGMIWVAKITTDGTTVTNIEQISPIIPCSNIEGFKQKILGTQRDVKVALIGDSITEGSAGGGTSWEDKLFDVAASSFGYNVPAIANFTVDNYGSGGATSHYGALLTAKAIKGGSGDYNSTGISWDAQDQSNAFAIADYDVLRDSPIYRGGYDLVIIGFGVNGGTHKMAHLENTIKNLRDKNIDVIVLTLNFRDGTMEEHITDGVIIKKMCDRYGAALADTWSFMRELEYEGTSTLADTVHPNDDGKTAYANSIRSVINDVVQPLGDNTPRQGRTIKDEDNQYLSMNFPNSSEFDGTPQNSTGTRIASSISNDLLNPSIQFNGEAKATSIIELEVGEVAYFSHGYASGFDIVIDGSTIGEFDYTQQNTTQIKGSVVHNSFTGNRPELAEGVQTGVFVPESGNLIGSHAIQIKCTSGTVKLYGILWHTYKTNTVQFRDVTLVGEWANEAEDYGLPNSLYTDRDGDYVTFEYEGSSAYVLLGRGSAGGLIDIYLNGEIYITGQDLYSGGTYWTPIHINSGISGNYDDVPIKKNVVTMVLNGENGSAGTPAAKNRRFGIASIKIMDRN